MSSTKPLSQSQIDDFNDDGYLLIKSFLDAEESELLSATAHGDDLMKQSAMDVTDAEGRKTNLSLWNHPGDDIYGMIARSHRAVDAMEQLLGDEVYHYHSKLSAKQPGEGGAWQWHQDYGYWYDNGCLMPDLASLLIAIDPATRENGCLEVLRGTQKLGRVDHVQIGEQTGADPQRVEIAKERYEHVYCEMAAGDALFFHSNLLHASQPNLSTKPRWALICCYNTKHNNPYKESHHPRYTPLEKVSNTMIKQIGTSGSTQEKKFLVQDEDQTTG